MNNIKNVFSRREIREIRPKKELFSFSKVPVQDISESQSYKSLVKSIQMKKQIIFSQNERIDLENRLKNLNNNRQELVDYIKEQLDIIREDQELYKPLSTEKWKKNFSCIEHNNNGDYSNTFEIQLNNKDYNINIFFYDNDFTLQMIKYEEELEEKNEDNSTSVNKSGHNVEDKPIPLVDFYMLIGKTSQSNNDGMILEGEIKSQSFIFETINFTKNLSTAHKDLKEGNFKFSEDYSDYMIPYSRISEHTENHFIKFLEEIGLNSFIAEFIEYTSTVKNSMLFLTWLNKIKQNLI